MKLILSATALSLYSLAASGAYADYSAGLRLTQIAMPHHGASTRVAIWYPTTSTKRQSKYASNPVFKGIDVREDTPVSAGRYPVVMFSHGLGGTDRSQAWLGAALAERGVVTVVVNHLNSTWGHFDMSKGVAHWTRAKDMSVALDTVLEMPEFSDTLDMSRVMAAGFSYGGWTAMSLGGAKGNHAGIVKACTNMPEMEACGMLLSDEVKMQDIDPELWNSSYQDERMTHVVAIDPGFVWGLEETDVADLLPSTLIIGLGSGKDRMIATDFDRSGLTDHLKDQRVERFDPAHHFTAMPICTPAGAAILKEEKDDPVCTDPAGTDRAEVHARLVDLIAKELGQ